MDKNSIHKSTSAQLKLFVALDLVERLHFFLLNPDLTLMAMGQG